MNGLRLIVVAAVLLLALAASGVRAKSASDSWNAPVASESWPSLEEFASEIELAHREFESTLAASSSSTGSSSSSSTGPTIVSSTGIKSSSTGVAKSSSSSTGVAKSSSSSTGVAKSSSSSTGVKASSSSSSSSSTGVSSSSSTGVSSSSSSTAAAPTVTTYAPALVAVSAPFNESTVPGGSAAAYADVIAAGIQSLAGNGSTVTAQACFVDADSTASTCPTATDDSSSRRLLQSSAKKLLIVITITPTSPLDSTASIIAAGVATQLGCGSNTTCQDQAAQSMASALTVATGVTVAPVTLNAAITQAAALSNNTDMQAAVAAALVTGFTVTSVDSGVITVTLESSSSSSSTGPDEQANYKLGAPSVATSGHANGTNAGYYVEAAVLALSAILSAMYMVMHKVDPSAVSFSKTQYGSNEAALAPVPSAEPAHGHVSIVNPDEAAPLGSQGQMDYKSVFALRNNVLEHKDHSHAEDNSNQNDVHFILHQ